MAVRQNYRKIPFCRETSYGDFYTYMDLKDIPEICESHINEIIKCRSIGVLQSVHGKYFLSDLAGSEPLVRVSLIYMQTFPQSTVIPYPVQIFGTLQWKNRPIIFAKLLQTLTVPTALKLKSSLSGIVSLHLATSVPEIDNNEEDVL